MMSNMMGGGGANPNMMIGGKWNKNAFRNSKEYSW